MFIVTLFNRYQCMGCCDAKYTPNLWSFMRTLSKYMCNTNWFVKYILLPSLWKSGGNFSFLQQSNIRWDTIARPQYHGDVLPLMSCCTPHISQPILIVCMHYNDVIMGAAAFQISIAVVYSTVHSGADQRKHQRSVSLALVWGIHRWPMNSPHTWPVTRKMFPFDDVIIEAMQWWRSKRRFRENHHASVVWNWHERVAIAYLYQSSP